MICFRRGLLVIVSPQKASSIPGTRLRKALMASMDIIATQRLFPGVEVEMAHYHSRVDIEHGPIHFAIRDEQLQLTPYEGQR